jgi:hypothetical protein
MLRQIVLSAVVAAALAGICHENVALYADGLCVIAVAHLPITTAANTCTAQSAEGQSFSIKASADCKTLTVYEGSSTCASAQSEMLMADGHCHKLCVGSQCGHYKIHNTASLTNLHFPASKRSAHLALRSFAQNPNVLDSGCKENITLYMDAACSNKVANLAMTLPSGFCMPNNGTGGQEFAMEIMAGCTTIHVYPGTTSCTGGSPITLTANGQCNEVCVMGQCGHYKIIESSGSKAPAGRNELGAYINKLHAQGKAKTNL